MLRSEYLESIGREQYTPHVKYYDFLIDYMNSLGYYRSNGMGIVGITYEEIKSYLSLTGDILSKFEVETLFLMSKYFCVYFQDTKIESKSPIYDEEVENMSIDKYNEIMGY